MLLVGDLGLVLGLVVRPRFLLINLVLLSMRHRTYIDSGVVCARVASRHIILMNRGRVSRMGHTWPRPTVSHFLPGPGPGASELAPRVPSIQHQSISIHLPYVQSEGIIAQLDRPRQVHEQGFGRPNRSVYRHDPNRLEHQGWLTRERAVNKSLLRKRPRIVGQVLVIRPRGMISFLNLVFVQPRQKRSRGGVHRPRNLVASMCLPRNCYHKRDLFASSCSPLKRSPKSVSLLWRRCSS
jgi:hypothetical protein